MFTLQGEEILKILDAHSRQLNEHTKMLSEHDALIERLYKKTEDIDSSQVNSKLDIAELRGDIKKNCEMIKQLRWFMGIIISLIIALITMVLVL